MDSELLLAFIGYFPDYLSAWSLTLLRSFWTFFVETAVYILERRKTFINVHQHQVRARVIGFVTAGFRILSILQCMFS